MRLFYSSLLSSRDVPVTQILSGRDVPAKRFLISRDDKSCLSAVDAVGCDPKDRPKKYINRYCVTSWLGDALTTAPFGPFFNNLQLARSRTVGWFENKNSLIFFKSQAGLFVKVISIL